MQVNKMFRLPPVATLVGLLGEVQKPAAIRDLAILGPTVPQLS
jgi:hypothetical protein